MIRKHNGMKKIDPQECFQALRLKQLHSLQINKATKPRACLEYSMQKM